MRRRAKVLLVLCLVICGAVVIGYAIHRKRPSYTAASFGQGNTSRFVDVKQSARLLRDEVGGYRKVHVFVALCDNKNQGIVPVPPGIGNGQDAKSNLYWGARYGMKTHFSRSRDWRLVESRQQPFPHILERVIFQHARKKVYLVADAYDGAYIKEAISETVLSSSGMHPEPVTIANQTYIFGGGADLIAYIGHDGLMEFSLDTEPTHIDARQRDAIILCCISEYYFTPLLKRAGAYPLLTTTQFMCPEAYTLEAALAGWVNNESPTRIHERAAQAYSQHQRCSVRAAKKLLKTGY